MAIDGRLARQLSEALLDAFSPERLDEMLYYRLSKQRARITMADNLETRVFHLIRAADSEGWLDRLVVAARQSRPEHAGLRQVAELRSLTPGTGGLETILSAGDVDIHPAPWRTRLGVLEGQVGLVEIAGDPAGTCFLIGPDLCMTSHHVVAAARRDEVRIVFDHKRDAADQEVFAGTAVELADDWLAASAPNSPSEWSRGGGTELPDRAELDFAVLRLAEPIGEMPVGGTGEPASADRGWIDVAGRRPPRPGDGIAVLQHFGRRPLQLRFGKVTEVNANGTRLRHTADTDGGSSGSPCFTLDWRLVAIHQAGDPATESWEARTGNRAVPVLPVLGLPAVSALLRRR
ncbi:hypothetical protein GCM10009827_069750 [Dactylosporangium maewongense]|uniref:Effector-associated domain-containing protein n=1 Tax=Dactylosporangium maewongense TaxID=634393 RepID=A0ABN2BI46_9ACTN